mmetsp:Transcript_25559/g.39097  ORF Transcript_25559/g.39097 Transcript_25559/m.39097 type:complete len:104 (+) Transcript_25559:300-611(+)
MSWHKPFGWIGWDNLNTLVPTALQILHCTALHYTTLHYTPYEDYLGEDMIGILAQNNIYPFTHSRTVSRHDDEMPECTLPTFTHTKLISEWYVQENESACHNW